MKHHHCHCGFEKHFAKFKNGRKLGILGVVLLGLHILWHVAECLVLPAIFVAFSHGHEPEKAIADEGQQTVSIQETLELIDFLPWRGAQPHLASASTAAAFFYPPVTLDTIRESFG